MKCPNCHAVIPHRVARQVTGPFATREELKAAVISDLNAGETGVAIAAKYGVSPATVHRFKYGDKKQRSVRFWD